MAETIEINGVTYDSVEVNGLLINGTYYKFKTTTEAVEANIYIGTWNNSEASIGTPAVGDIIDVSANVDWSSTTGTPSDGGTVHLYVIDANGNILYVICGTYNDGDTVTVTEIITATSGSSSGGTGEADDAGYKVNFYSDGVLYASISVAAGASVNSLATNPRNNSSGTAFVGWATVKDSADDIITFPFTPTGDTTLYAVYGFSTVLNDNPWSVISNAASLGTASSYWAVGDMKEITISGTVGTLSINTTVCVYILGFNHNSSVEGENLIHFGGFKDSLVTGVDICLIDSNHNTTSSDGTKYFNMNHWGSSSTPYNTNYGGWKGCDLRYDILGSTDIAPFGYGSTATTSRTGYDASTTCATNPVSGTLMAALPSELRAVMKPITKYTDNTGNATATEACVTTSVDYLPLLAEYEIFGTRTYANTYEQNYQKQYSYFANGNSKVKYGHSASTSTARWWERSPYYSNAGNFCYVYTSGGANGNNSRCSYGLAPAFAV